MDQLYGPSTALDKMIRLLKLFNWSTFDPIPEGPMAHEITDESIKTLIVENYNKRYRPEITPYTHPENFDPLNPPSGWAYDPYYECWIETE